LFYLFIFNHFTTPVVQQAVFSSGPTSVILQQSNKRYSPATQQMVFSSGPTSGTLQRSNKRYSPAVQQVIFSSGPISAILHIRLPIFVDCPVYQLRAWHKTMSAL